MAQGSNQNIVQEFGLDQAHKQENANRWKERGHPKQVSNDEDGENWNEKFDPNMKCEHYLDGSWTRRCYGKNPSHDWRHVSGNHGGMVQDGANWQYRVGPKFSVNKSDYSETNNGSHDKVTYNVSRANSGTEKGGGAYHDAGKGGMAHGAGTGSFAKYSDKDMNFAAANSFKMTAGDGHLTVGRGDEGGQYSQYLTLHKDGKATLYAKGDVTVQTKAGMKLAAKGGMSIEGGTVTVSSKSGPLSLSGASTLNLAGGSDILASHPLPANTVIKTNYPRERGIHSGTYNTKSGNEASSQQIQGGAFTS